MDRSWIDFPYDQDPYRYEGDALSAHWGRLHRGDREPFPSEEYLAELDERHGILNGDDPEQIAGEIQDAWRAFHAGDFAEAVGRAERLGVLGASVAAKAQGIYATYLEKSDEARLKLFKEAAGWAEVAQGAMPGSANGYYFQAFNLGRYGQWISITKALAQGLGGKVKASLDRAIELDPEHADAHIALGLYHAEIINKVGKMVGKLTYGASADAAMEHFETALDLFPESPIARMEFANGLLLLKGDKAFDQASELYVTASEADPADAMERLDVEQAKSELE